MNRTENRTSKRKKYQTFNARFWGRTGHRTSRSETAPCDKNTGRFDTLWRVVNKTLKSSVDVGLVDSYIGELM